MANLSALEIVDLDTRDNLRNYIAEYSANKRNRVHESIRNTILTEPQRFITRNSGFAISASDIKVDDEAKIVTLTNGSILNGAQTQGEIKRWIRELYPDGIEELASQAPFYVRAEIIVDPDDQEVVETAIARNTATPVKSISQAGARGHLNELQSSMQRHKPGFRIQMSETDDPAQAFDTRKLLQYTRLLMPSSVSQNASDSEKVRAYKMAEQCLTDFSRWHDAKDSDAAAKRKFDFAVQMAPVALEEYRFWETHPAWNGQRVWEETRKGRACRRDTTGKIVWVTPALVFPILGAMSEFVVEKTPGVWSIEKPAIFKPEEMIARTVQQFRGVDSDPILMGRSPGVYDALRIYPATLVEVMRDVNDMKDAKPAAV
ncbi:AIPR protein [Knoellia remsis]|uniref:AIPR protein n=1 Tax=Knoellia remsis TaxID=407159 RepID=A0A2T0UGS3_9MICO|nr:AIPR family protein [Knoellia remsis]PRY57151.1 AIPR protein [Knoellia remsis]